MEFGKLDDIGGVNWSLPIDESRHFTSLNGSAKIKIGSPAWGAKQWIGKIYPEKTSSEKFLYHYSRNFNCIELNTTHYRIPDEVTTQEWLSEVPTGFIFCPKVYKDISHSKAGMLDRNLLKVWLAFLERMQSHLGPCFIQFHELFAYNDKMFLFKFLENWPSEFKLSLELRHSSWFQHNRVLPALTDYLHKKGIGLVITDVAGRRDVLHSTLTSDWSMVRIIGNNLHETDESRLHGWVTRLKEWHNKGIQENYFFLHQPDDIWTIEFAQMAHRVFLSHGFSVPSFEFVKPWDLFNAP